MMGTTVITGPTVDPVVVGTPVDPVGGPDGFVVVPEGTPGVVALVLGIVPGVEPGFEGSVEPPVEPPGVPGVEVGVETGVESGVDAGWEGFESVLKLPEWRKLKDEPRVMVLNVLGMVKVSELPDVVKPSPRIISASPSDRSLASTARLLVPWPPPPAAAAVGVLVSLIAEALAGAPTIRVGRVDVDGTGAIRHGVGHLVQGQHVADSGDVDGRDPGVCVQETPVGLAAPWQVGLHVVEDL
ncbi:hypothetical protein N7474_007120 [Penicillium riverlandense]|uniref:uncharacterized protein n=1 Tax=Penicillium riverlandense TaxID=1903569 RepID=UPI00254905C2|nr:uncharacterized protein N7474_007120 [Penicillium riverlandense]KAJ5815343.1 hypothetical protein N7474_007120 [Penicillium riverlandense]